jgi:hypothetical protein
MCDYTFPKIAPNSTERMKMPTQYSAGFAYQEVINVRRVGRGFDGVFAWMPPSVTNIHNIL